MKFFRIGFSQFHEIFRGAFESFVAIFLPILESFSKLIQSFFFVQFFGFCELLYKYFALMHPCQLFQYIEVILMKILFFAHLNYQPLDVK